MHGEFLGHRIFGSSISRPCDETLKKCICVVVAIVILGYYFITFKVSCSIWIK